MMARPPGLLMASRMTLTRAWTISDAVHGMPPKILTSGVELGRGGFSDGTTAWFIDDTA